MPNINKKTSKKKNSGFTLIELVVVISVAAILSSIAVPNFRSLIESNRTTAATNELVSALILARSEALKRTNNVSVCTSLDQVSCAGNVLKDFAGGWIVFQDCNANGIIDALADCDNDGAVDDAEATIKAHLEIKGIKITRNGAAASKHFFSYTFSGRSATATFSVRKKGTGNPVLRKIITSRSGRVRTCKPSEANCN